MRRFVLLVLGLAVTVAGGPGPADPIQDAAGAIGGETSRAARRGELGLLDCIAIARLLHEDSVIARERVREAQAGVEGAEAGGKPRLQVDVDTRLGNVGPRIVDPSGSGTVVETSSDLEAYVNLSWSILDPRRSRLIARAKRLEEQTRASALGILRDLDHQVATAYVELMRAQEALRLQREILGIDEASVRIAEARQRLGDGTETETIQARAQLALVAQALLAAESDVQKARLALLSAMGLREDPGVTFVREEPPVDVSPPALPLCLEVAYANRDDVRALQSALDVARVDLSLARLGSRISYAISSSAYTTASSGFGDVNWQVAFKATIPIFDGGAARSELRSAEARQIISEAEVSLALRQVWESVTKAYRDWESAREQVIVSRFAAEASQRSLERTQAAYEAGLASLFDTLDARLQYLQARSQVVTSEAALARSLWDLERACPGAVPQVNPLAAADEQLEELLREAEETTPHPDDAAPPQPGGRR